MTDRELIFLALSARGNAYAPYSGFGVGAALLCRDGSVFTGCNIENAAFTPTICAERTAFFKAISAGKREFDRIAICGCRIGGEPEAVCTPCGVCRQVMAEFCDPDRFTVICCGGVMANRAVSQDAERAETVSLRDLISGSVADRGSEPAFEAAHRSASETDGTVWAESDVSALMNKLPKTVYAETYLLRTLLPHGFSGKIL